MLPVMEIHAPLNLPFCVCLFGNACAPQICGFVALYLTLVEAAHLGFGHEQLLQGPTVWRAQAGRASAAAGSELGTGAAGQATAAGTSAAQSTLPADRAKLAAAADVPVAAKGLRSMGKRQQATAPSMQQAACMAAMAQAMSAAAVAAEATVTDSGTQDANKRFAVGKAISMLREGAEQVAAASTAAAALRVALQDPELEPYTTTTTCECWASMPHEMWPSVGAHVAELLQAADALASMTGRGTKGWRLSGLFDIQGDLVQAHARLRAAAAAAVPAGDAQCTSPDPLQPQPHAPASMGEVGAEEMAARIAWVEVWLHCTDPPLRQKLVPLMQVGMLRQISHRCCTSSL